MSQKLALVPTDLIEAISKMAFYLRRQRKKVSKLLCNYKRLR
jgi:hypothetical protein